MNGRLLAVDTNTVKLQKQSTAWLKYGITLEQAPSMQCAIEKLCNKNYIMVGINADTITFEPLLGILRECTPSPITVLSSSPSVKERIIAYELGANQYLAWENEDEPHVKSGLAYIQGFHDYCNRVKPLEDTVFYKSIFIFPTRRQAFMMDCELSLTSTEFELLCLLAQNHHRVVPYKNILEYVPEYESNTNPTGALQAHMKRLRSKLKSGRHTSIQITSVQNIGYRLE